MTVRKDNQFGQRWSILRWFLIPDATEPDKIYLRRLRIVQTPLFGVYVHWIYLPDSDRDPHDHPWPFLSFIVRGGYTERVHWTRSEFVWRDRKRFSLHRHPTSIAHIINTLKPDTMTLIFVGRRSREWGFWTDTGFVGWRDYDRSGLGPDPYIEYSNRSPR